VSDIHPVGQNLTQNGTAIMASNGQPEMLFRPVIHLFGSKNKTLDGKVLEVRAWRRRPCVRHHDTCAPGATPLVCAGCAVLQAAWQRAGSAAAHAGRCSSQLATMHVTHTHTYPVNAQQELEYDDQRNPRNFINRYIVLPKDLLPEDTLSVVLDQDKLDEGACGGQRASVCVGGGGWDCGTVGLWDCGAVPWCQRRSEARAQGRRARHTQRPGPRSVRCRATHLTPHAARTHAPHLARTQATTS
jgi:hypothetical protein